MPAKTEKQRKFFGALKLRLPINASCVEFLHLLFYVSGKIVNPIRITVSLPTTLALGLFLTLCEAKDNIRMFSFEEKIRSNFFKQGNTPRARPFDAVRRTSPSLKVTRVTSHLASTMINHFFNSIQKCFIGQSNPYKILPSMIMFGMRHDSFQVDGYSSFAINDASNIGSFFFSHIISIPYSTNKVKEGLYVPC